MDVSMLVLFGISSALINAVAFVPYIRSIFMHKTKPERSSWWIWSVLMAVALAAQISAGATWSALFTAVFVIGNILVAILSVKYGYGTFTTKNTISIIITIAALLLWYITNNPLLALVLTIFVDFLAYILTITKAWKAPYSENLLAWALMAIAAILGVVSVGFADITLVLFQLYVAIVTVVGVSILLHRRKWRSDRIKQGIQNRYR